MGQVFSRENIKVQIIADSIGERSGRITTFELTYPRIIHSEFMTHRLFSRNAMSSRAVPIKTMIKLIKENMAMPVRFGSNQPGMQDKGVEHDSLVTIDRCNKVTGREAWAAAAYRACDFAQAFDDAGYHKQIANRLIEPFQMMKTVMTTTEMDNFLWLRVDADADPTIEVLANLMKEALDNSEPELLQPGTWHTPYVDHVYGFGDGEGEDEHIFEGYCVLDENDTPVMLTEEEALRISASCCGQVSYRRLNSTKDKALDIYTRLVAGKKVHASPFEHQAKEIEETIEDVEDGLLFQNVFWAADTWEEGITHVDREGNFWSGNFKGWIQHRQLIPGHVAK
ncbi:thymidylate synthase, flavin-dependent [Salmonella phage SSBI34]|nr:thymidylate synthase, flavin-dependent [Salmonella phage SSBI34]